MHKVTPLIESPSLSQRTSKKVYLKLENAQQTGSFKIRGIGYNCTKAVRERGAQQLFASSGGNAGVAVSFAAKKLGVPCTVVVPETTSAFAVNKIQQEGSTVIVHGKTWSEAHEKATELAKEPNSELIHPFDHPEIWEGHRSLIHECSEQLGTKPDAVITVCGGGGLMIGIVQGMKEVGWDDVPVYVSETQGAESLHAAIKAAPVAVEAFNVTKQHQIISCVVTDKAAVAAVSAFLTDHQALVEPSCGAALLYNEQYFKDYFKDFQGEKILVVVCGGTGVNLEALQKWNVDFDL